MDTTNVKQYFWYLFGIMGVVFFWAGVWDGLGNLYILQNPLISLLVGVVMLTLSGVIFRDTNPLWGKRDKKSSILNKLHTNPNKHLFDIIYHDKAQNKEINFNAGKLTKIEKGHLVIIEDGKEIFIPKSRVISLLNKTNKKRTDVK
ncbi:hypothetical protein COV17_04075 [Candidatus Woesearchaeota archaeon CG10_big_fil_rev_8_21_14_0_10_36_11]|nr:MAG: hypothetical protein COV17_04075 [Candidatus Woesearchaeota archaeon CG10_big_fil_rev_8_21_14_0_10_36_11]